MGRGLWDSASRRLAAGAPALRSSTDAASSPPQLGSRRAYLDGLAGRRQCRPSRAASDVQRSAREGLALWHAVQVQAAATGEGSGARPVQHRGGLDRGRPWQTAGGRTIWPADGTTGETTRPAAGGEGFQLSRRVRPVLGADWLVGRPRGGPAGSSRASQAPRQPDADGDAERQRQQAARNRAGRPRPRPVVAPHPPAWPTVAVATAPAPVHDHAQLPSCPQSPSLTSGRSVVDRRRRCRLRRGEYLGADGPDGHAFSVAALCLPAVMPAWAAAIAAAPDEVIRAASALSEEPPPAGAARRWYQCG
jgi:hypothetical protein